MNVLDERSQLEAIEGLELLGDHKAAKKLLKKYRLEKEEERRREEEKLKVIPHLKAL